MKRRERTQTHSTKKYSGMVVKLNRAICTYEERDPYKGRLNLTYSYRDYYPNYVLDCKEAGNEPVTRKEYISFLERYFTLIMHEVAYEAFILIMPFGLGRFYLQKSNKQGFRFEYNRMGKYIESFGKFYYFRWDKNSSYVKNRVVQKWTNSTFTKRFTIASAKGEPSPLTNKWGLKKGPVGHFHNEGKWGTLLLLAMMLI